MLQPCDSHTEMLDIAMVSTVFSFPLPTQSAKIIIDGILKSCLELHHHLTFVEQMILQFTDCHTPSMVRSAVINGPELEPAFQFAVFVVEKIKAFQAAASAIQ